MSVVELGGKLKGGSTLKVDTAQGKLANNIAFPLLERLSLDCSNCKFTAFTLQVSPLKLEIGKAAVIQEIRCARCNAPYKIHDGIIGGASDEPVARVRK